MSEEEIFRAINDVQARYSNVVGLIKTLESHIKINDGKLDVANDNKSNQNKILADLKISIDKCMGLAQASHTHLSNELEKLKNSISITNDAQAEAMVSFADLSKALDNEKDKLSSFKEHVSNSIAFHLAEFRIEFGQFIASLPKPKIPSSEEISSAIRLQVEPVAIDAKNGCLRSANCDLRLTIAEKKIDQIFLLLQKHSMNTGQI
jgi:hypothetical protein